MNSRIEKYIILIGGANEKNLFFAGCADEFRCHASYDDTHDYGTTLLSNYTNIFLLGYAYDCCSPDYFATEILKADAVIYLSSATHQEIEIIEKMRQQNKRCVGIDITQMNISPLECLKQIDYFQSQIEKDSDTKLKLSTVISATLFDNQSPFFQLPIEVTKGIASHYFFRCSNKSILTTPPSEQQPAFTLKK
jgi:hypothetical protein